MGFKLYLGEAFGLIGKTMPFIWLRLASYAALGLGLAIYAAVFGGLAFLLGSLWQPLGVIVFLVTFFGAFGVVHWVTRYYFYLLKAAHTAVMTEYIVYGQAPQGSQIAYGKEQVMQRFGSTSAMFAVDRLIDGVVRAFTRTFSNLSRLLPIPGMNSLTALLRRVALYATTYIDEAILSRAYKEREQDIWQAAQDGIVLYAQAWKPVLGNALVLALLSFVEFIAFVILLGLPALALGAALPALRVALGIGVLIGAWMLKLALSDAFSLASTLIAYHRATEGLEPDSSWKERLAGLSDKFNELGRRAQQPRSTTANGRSTHSGSGATSPGILR